MLSKGDLKKKTQSIKPINKLIVEQREYIVIYQ
jgi:hypothetical protein